MPDLAGGDEVSGQPLHRRHLRPRLHPALARFRSPHLPCHSPAPPLHRPRPQPHPRPPHPSLVLHLLLLLLRRSRRRRRRHLLLHRSPPRSPRPRRLLLGPRRRGSREEPPPRRGRPRGDRGDPSHLRSRFPFLLSPISMSNAPGLVSPSAPCFRGRDLAPSGLFRSGLFLTARNAKRASLPLPSLVFQDHPEASHCKDLHIDGEKEEASQHDQERPVENADTFFSTESLDDSFQHGPTTVSCQDGPHVTQSDGNFQAIPEKPAEEIMMMSFGMESLDDISFSPTAAAVKQVGKFQPKLASRPKGGKAKSVSFALPNASETTAPSVETCSEGNFTRTDPPVGDVINDGYLDNHQQSSSVNYDFNGDFQMDDGKLEEEDISESSGLESFNTLLSLPISTAGKFQPKPSARTENVKSNASAVQTGAMECVQCECDSLPPEAESLEVHASGFPADSLVDSAMPMPSELAQEQAELFEACTLEAATLGGRKTTQTIEISSERDNHVSGEREPTELLQDICVEAHSPNVEELTQLIQEEKHNSETVEDIAASKPSRKLRKQIYMHGTGKPEGGSDEDQSDDEYRGEDVPKKKRVPKKSKGKMTEKKKSGKKRKRASGKPDSISEELPKKRFPRGTRRKRRQVNKVLLETPEDEIDRRQLRIKDLIMLAEAKERISSKEAATLRKSFPNQSTGSFPSRTYLDEGNLFGEEEEQNLDGEGNHNIQPNSTKLNYHSYMNRPQSVRWSKADTELFYQAIRQFGTDFAMIQQLFPNRTRHQVKLKFKNEERKHPLQVHDALVHRSKDHAHFERVILQLQTQAEQNSHKETTGDPQTASQDVAGEYEEEGGKLNKEEEANGWGGEVRSPADSDWKFEAPDQPELAEYESVYDWDAGASYPHDMEKDTFTEF